MRACARSISAGRIMAELLLALNDVRAGYGDAVVLDGISFEVPKAQQPRGARAQRRRQDDASAHHHGLHPRQPRHDRLARPRHHPPRAASPCTRRPWLGGAGARDISLAQRRGEPDRGSRPGRWDLEAVYELFPRLNERRASRGNHLSGGEQQMLATARALMTNPIAAAARRAARRPGTDHRRGTHRRDPAHDRR